jgi:hypothetical protein
MLFLLSDRPEAGPLLHRSPVANPHPFRDYAILVAIAMAGFVIIGWAVAIAT